MISNSYHVNAYEGPVESTSPVVPLNNIYKTHTNAVMRREYEISNRGRAFAHPQNTRLVTPEHLSTSYSKPGSCPNGFLSTWPQARHSYEQESSSESLSEQYSDEDTESYMSSGDGDENELTNEIKSRNDADDELASIFGSDEA